MYFKCLGFCVESIALIRLYDVPVCLRRRDHVDDHVVVLTQRTLCNNTLVHYNALFPRTKVSSSPQAPGRAMFSRYAR